STSSIMSFPTVGVRCRGFPIELSFRAFHRSGCRGRNWSPHPTTSSSHHRTMVAAFFPPLAPALAEAVEATIKCSVVKVKRQSLHKTFVIFLDGSYDKER